MTTKNLPALADDLDAILLSSPTAAVDADGDIETLLPDPAPSERREAAAALAPLNPRHAAFVRLYVASGNATTAARSAGYRHARVTGSRILNRPDVQQSVAKLRDLVAARAVYDFAKASDDLTAAIAFAYQQGQPMAVAKAVELKAKLHGMLNDRLDVRHQGDLVFNFLPLNGGRNDK